MVRIKTLTAIVIIASFIVSPIAQAHPGRTDAQGCHTCYTNCTEEWGLEYGEYHCHAEKIKKVKTESKSEARKEARKNK